MLRHGYRLACTVGRGKEREARPAKGGQSFFSIESGSRKIAFAGESSKAVYGERNSLFLC